MEGQQRKGNQQSPSTSRSAVRLLSLLGAASVAVVGVQASIDPSQPPSSSQPHHGAFTYYSTGAFELDLSSSTTQPSQDKGREDSGDGSASSSSSKTYNPQQQSKAQSAPRRRHPNHHASTPSSSSQIQSELVFGDLDHRHHDMDSGSDSGCFVSTHAIMDRGGEQEQSSDGEESILSSFWMNGGSSIDERNNNNSGSPSQRHADILKQLEEAMEKAMEEKQDEEDDDDDDDDDNDDGHSSMLSNASLRRRVSSSYSVVSSSSATAATSYNNNPQRVVASTTQTATKHRRQQLSQQHRGIQSALQIRGGADATAATSSLSSLLSSDISKKLVTTALVTLIFEGMIGHILEFLKIVMQTSETTYLEVLRKITSEKGIFGLWDGFCPWGIVQAVAKGAVFGLAHAAAARVLIPLAKSKSWLPLPLALTLAGGIGGGFQGYVLSPTLLLKTRVMTNPVFREKMSVWRTTLLSFRIGWDVVQTEGVATLMKGSNVFALKRVFDWSSRYFFADLFEALFVKLKNGQPLTVTEKSVSSLLGGVASTCVTLPLDVLVAKTQDAKKAGIQVSPLRLFQEELQEKGLTGLKDAYMRGFEARLLHVCLTTVVVKTFTPIAYEALFGASSATTA